MYKNLFGFPSFIQNLTNLSFFLSLIIIVGIDLGIIANDQVGYRTMELLL